MEPENQGESSDNKKMIQSANRNLSATPQRLATLFRENMLPHSAWKLAQRYSGMIPTGDEWLRFTDILFASMGTIFLLAGIVFFFAFNWDDLSRTYRFAVVEGAVILSTFLAFIFNLDKWAGRLALGATAILTGVALAVVGQEYQSGADSYRLFMTWCFLISGWVLISRWNIMYLIWMILLNITVALYWEQVIRTDWHMMNLILLSANAGFVFLWESITHRFQFRFMVEGRWFLYIVMLLATGHATILMGDYILGTKMMENITILQPLAYIVMAGLSIGFYMIIRRDLLMLTFTSLSLLVIGIIWSGDFLWQGFGETGDGIAYFFVMAIITVSLTALLAWGLRSLNQRWERNHG